MSEIEKNISEEDKLNTSNIFDEFEVDEETIEEIENLNNKDLFYYLNKIGIFLKYINFFLLFIVIILFGYVYIQKSESKLFDEKDYLNPICYILLGVENYGNKCSGLYIYNNEKINELEKLKSEYFRKISKLLLKINEVTNIKNSKEFLFIVDKFQNKNDPIKILNDFDIIKNKFTLLDKQKIRCNDIIIKNDILEAKCSAYSTAWYDDIPGYEGGNTVNRIGGTSITLASSFINFISKSESFTVIEKQKQFNLTPYFGEGNYVYKTDFKLKIKYNNFNNLSL